MEQNYLHLFYLEVIWKMSLKISHKNFKSTKLVMAFCNSVYTVTYIVRLQIKIIPCYYEGLRQWEIKADISDFPISEDYNHEVLEYVTCSHYTSCRITISLNCSCFLIEVLRPLIGDKKVLRKICISVQLMFCMHWSFLVPLLQLVLIHLFRYKD